MEKLPREFYNRDTTVVAKELLGKYLVFHQQDKQRIGKIVEVEAYLGSHDLASHSRRGLTPRTRIMYGAPGYAYIYLIYGKYHCMNVVTEQEGHGSAVLIRALEPIVNIEKSTKGPGLLCQAMDINKQLNGYDLLSDNFYIAMSAESEPFKLIKRPRIGVAYAKHWANRLLRFYIKDNQYISKK